MKTLVAFPSPAVFGQHAALAFHEGGQLEAFMTTYAHLPSRPLARALRSLPGRIPQRVSRELGRRAITVLPEEVVETRPFWELVRTGAAKSGFGTRTVDRIWDHLSKDFARAAGTRILRRGAIYGYEYSALEAFHAAADKGAAKILDFPSLNSRQFEELQREQKVLFPELVGPDDAYFEALFETRQKRRDDEMALADVIITNSSLTRASHIAGGADPERTFAVPYGAPPPIDSPRKRDVAGPLRVLWAGTFSIRKGAHLFLQAWRHAVPTGSAVCEVYGAVPLPERLRRPEPAGVAFMGSVTRDRLFEAFEMADVLVFPTLSDGFGMVVTEAFARGLPVITTDQAGASDLMRDGVTGKIIPAGDADAIAGALTWCLDNRAELTDMRPAALQAARDWQWTDYRRALREAVAEGLSRAKFDPSADS